MARMSQGMIDQLRKCYFEELLSPKDAALEVGCSYSTALRYYNKWMPEIECTGMRLFITKRYSESKQKDGGGLPKIRKRRIILRD